MTDALLGRWELVEAFCRRGEAEGPTHEFDSAREFLDAVDTFEDRWHAPEVVRPLNPFDAWLELGADGRFAQHEEPQRGVTQWFSTPGPEVLGTWEATPDDDEGFVLRLRPSYARKSWASPYFDQWVPVESSEIHRRIVTVSDGVHVSAIDAYLRRPGAEPTPSRVERYIAGRVGAIRALAEALDAGGAPEAIAVAVGGRYGPLHRALQAARVGAAGVVPWACSPEVSEPMARIHTAVRGLKNPRPNWKAWVDPEVHDYLQELRTAARPP